MTALYWRRAFAAVPILVFVVCATAFPSRADGQGSVRVTLWGPAVFDRAPGRPTTEHLEFTIPASAHEPFALIVENGDTSGAGLVSSARIFLNGREVAHPSDFNQVVTRFEIPVMPSAGPNTIEVTLAGAPSGFLRVSLAGWSSTFGPQGGALEITDPASPMFGARVQIPAGALSSETAVLITPFLRTDLDGAVGRALPSTMRFFGGLTVDVGDAELTKPISIEWPNTFGATANDQLLVGRLDPTRPAPANLLFQGFARLGSIAFTAASGGSFAVISPATPIVVLRGTLVNLAGQPVAGATIVSGMPTLISAVTDNDGQFVIPASPPGSYALLGAISPSRSVGLIGLPLPPTTPVFPIKDLVESWIVEKLDLEQPDTIEPCEAEFDPAEIQLRERQSLVPGHVVIAANENARTFVLSGGRALPGDGVDPDSIEEKITDGASELLGALWDGTLTIFERVTFRLADTRFARFSPAPTPVGDISETGRILGLGPGSVTENAVVEIETMCFDASGPAKVAFATIPVIGIVDVFGIITDADLPPAITGVGYSANLQTSPFGVGVSFSATGLPLGLRIDPTTSGAQVVGTPEEPGRFSVPIEARDQSLDLNGTNPAPLIDQKTFELSVFGITTQNLPNGDVGQQYSATVAAVEGTGTYMWSATGLPAGLTLDPASGTISGVPTTTGTFTIVLTVTDQSASPKTAEKSLPLTIGGATYTIRLNPWGTQNISAGPFQIESLRSDSGVLSSAPAASDITVTLLREVISPCRGILFSSNRTMPIAQGQVFGGSLDAAGRDPNCNALPITTRWTITQAVTSGGAPLDLAVVPAAEKTVAIIR